MKFGQYAILQPVEHRFEREPDWYWKIKPVTTGDEVALSQFLSAERTAILPDGSRTVKRIANIEIALREIALTFAGTNITDESGKLILEQGATIEQIEAALRTMPNEMVNELWTAVGDAIPTWGPVKPKN
jgi:hypothetical protein